MRFGASYICYLITKPDGSQIGLAQHSMGLKTFPGINCFEKGKIIHPAFTPFESLGEMTFENFLKDSCAESMPKIYQIYKFINKMDAPKEETVTPIVTEDLKPKKEKKKSSNKKADVVKDEPKKENEKKDEPFTYLTINFNDYEIFNIKYPDTLFKSSERNEFSFSSNENIDLKSDSASIQTIDKKGFIVRTVKLHDISLRKLEDKKYILMCEWFDDIIH